MHIVNYVNIMKEEFDMWTREEVKTRGKAALKRNYWNAVLVALVMGICAGGSGGSAGNSARNNGGNNVFQNLSPEVIAAIMGTVIVLAIVGCLLKIFVFNPLSVSCQRFFVLNDSENATLNVLSYGFKNNYMNIVKVMFLKDLYVFLWTLLLIVPGIIKSYEYMLVPYMLAEDSSLSSSEIFGVSKDMMMGNKMDAFVLQLSFIGWVLLSLLTCGILLVFYVNPYIYGSMAAMYVNIRNSFAPVDNNYDPYQAAAF